MENKIKYNFTMTQIIDIVIYNVVTFIKITKIRMEFQMKIHYTNNKTKNFKYKNFI